MAATYVDYDASKPMGFVAARLSNGLRVSWDDTNRLWNALTAATNGGVTKTAAVMVAFGIPSGDDAMAVKFYDAVYGIKTLLDGTIAGGLPSNIASLDRGIPG